MSTSLYASYYFQLRTLCQRENREFPLKPMDVEAAAKLEARGLAYQAKFTKEAGKRNWASADNAPGARVTPLASLTGLGQGAPDVGAGFGKPKPEPK